MNVYFYCSYEHSQKGFFMTQLEGKELKPAAEIPQVVEMFFSFDRFQALWLDICSTQEKKFFNPNPTGSFLGFRNLRGKMFEGRNCVVNIAFLGDQDEISLIRKIALTVLRDYSDFEQKITSLLSIGGECSYQINVNSFNNWLENCANVKKMHKNENIGKKVSAMIPYFKRSDLPSFESELLKLAVYTTDKNDVFEFWGKSKFWHKKHPCILDVSEFNELFVISDPSWELN